MPCKSESLLLRSRSELLKKREYLVMEAHVGMRADKFLVLSEPELSRDRARDLFRQNKVRIEGQAIVKSYLLKAGQRVVLLAAPEPWDFLPAPDPSVPLHIVFKDDEVVIASKAPGIPCHPLQPDETGTLVQGLLAQYQNMASVGYAKRESGLVHRIDTFTSGIVLAAQNQNTFTFLRNELREGRVEKHYLALCHGKVCTQTIDLPIAGDPRSTNRMLAGEIASKQKDSKAARTVVLESAVLRGSNDLSFIKLSVDSGRRHQIRVHLSTLGHPLLGDILYGGKSTAGLQGHFLHASTIRFKHPKRKEIIEATAALPPERQTLLDKLKQ